MSSFSLNAQQSDFSTYACLLLTAYLSDRLLSRGIPIAFGCTLSGVGYILLCFLTDDRGKYGSTFLVAIVRPPDDRSFGYLNAKESALGLLHVLPHRPRLGPVHLRG